MKENDIMLGDWVRRRWTCTDTGREVVKDFQVTEIHKLGNFLYAWGKSGNMGRVEQLEPIPLTAEIMEKNFPGPEVIVWWPFLDGFHCETQTYGDIMVSGKFRYAHQLQHALRLCWIDADIVI